MDERMRAAERAFRADPTDEHYREYARQALRAGDPLVRFAVYEGASIRGPRDPDNSCCWIALLISGRALPTRRGIREGEWADTRIAQLPLSQIETARVIAAVMNESERALTHRWGEVPYVQQSLHISSQDYVGRVHSGAQEAAAFPEIYEQFGFSIVHTGGGCTAWTIEAEDGRHVLITGGDAFVPEPDDDDVFVGLYTADGDWVEDAGREFPNTAAGTRLAVAYAIHLLGLPPG
jgi:hypothetical protein